ncbi:hypothetical protein SDC9_198671 [bioreactor metagenome]|uniref:Uncharacterized protein n=1 Tax=bioreactor metagenome TaxID=1076179 RepID=A0A645IIT1_9ZZZZ
MEICINFAEIGKNICGGAEYEKKYIFQEL